MCGLRQEVRLQVSGFTSVEHDLFPHVTIDCCSSEMRQRLSMDSWISRFNLEEEAGAADAGLLRLTS
jgi:hypothetical protein